MTSKDTIRDELRARGTLADCARRHGILPQMISGALAGPCLSGEIAIAKTLGTTPWALWPDRWANVVAGIVPAHSRMHQRIRVYADWTGTPPATIAPQAPPRRGQLRGIGVKCPHCGGKMAIRGRQAQTPEVSNATCQCRDCDMVVVVQTSVQRVIHGPRNQVPGAARAATSPQAMDSA